MTSSELAVAIGANVRKTRALAERVDYLFVAVMRGDPRFTKPEHANPAFDAASFDADWLARGKRVPSREECLGAGS
jgi:hypothetical protein